MDKDLKRPNAALINREWFEAASNVLNSDDLGLVLVNACRYVYGLPKISMKTPMQHAVFVMILPALDSDVNKYVERCARNAANARSQSQRVAASGTQSQRVAANTTTTTTTTTTSTTTTKPSLSSVEDREKERFLVYGYFWSTGSKAVAQEANAFWDYYESLGWKNNKGAAIVNKLACARQWRPQFETGTAPAGAVEWFRVCRECDTPDINVFRAYAGAERIESGAVVRLRCRAQFLSDMMEHIPNLKRSLQAAWKVPEVTFETLGS